ncbi:hypothetical protein Cgig2_004985 [Carnegiea gigantea]|uniref:DNA-directed RNA polymerase RBP11-like dimerisation domain-containing protein n=1 Tax=Carnegiea gigantea TaxID=171969 RepID=A0A9Q1L187_9CARY|nr:hypothetical protein Cgig2_004985 [Carnegiea gigantea]
MEHGSYKNPSASTISIAEEDHTLANSLRLVLNKDPRVISCGYSIPHPSEACVNISVQTTGDPASEVLKDSCQNLIYMCEHVRRTFDDVVAKFKGNPKDAMDEQPTDRGTNTALINAVCQGVLKALKGQTGQAGGSGNMAAGSVHGAFAGLYY